MPIISSTKEHYIPYNVPWYYFDAWHYLLGVCWSTT